MLYIWILNFFSYFFHSWKGRPVCIQSQREILAGSARALFIFFLPVIKLPLCAAGHRVPKTFVEFFQPPFGRTATFSAAWPFPAYWTFRQSLFEWGAYYHHIDTGTCMTMRFWMICRKWVKVNLEECEILFLLKCYICWKTY